MVLILMVTHNSDGFEGFSQLFAASHTLHYQVKEMCDVLIQRVKNHVVLSAAVSRRAESPERQ